MSDRNAVIVAIRHNLKERTGRKWSVTGGTGTSWGWIRIDAPPSRKGAVDTMPMMDRDTLKWALGLESVHQQGVNIPASAAHRREFVERSLGRVPAKAAEPYWD